MVAARVPSVPFSGFNQNESHPIGFLEGRVNKKSKVFADSFWKAELDRARKEAVLAREGKRTFADIQRRDTMQLAIAEKNGLVNIEKLLLLFWVLMFSGKTDTLQHDNLHYHLPPL